MQSLELIKTPYIHDIQKGLLEEGHFLLKKIHLHISKKNKPFIRVLLADKTGHLPGVFFGSKQELESIASSLRESDIVQISGIIEEYQGILQIKLIKIEKSLKVDWDLSRFWKRTPHDRRELYNRLKDFIQKITDENIKRLCVGFLKDRNFMRLFLDAPASRFVHHAYIGGLIEHSLNVIELVYAYARIYTDANRDLLICGAFLHDIGKIDEYEYLFSIDHSSIGKLKGHSVLGYDRLTHMMNHIEFSDDNLRLKLEHIILSHQGKRIWGAVEEPRFLEAYLIHAADSTDSSQFIYSNAKKFRSNEKETANPYWSDYVAYLGREIYLG